MFRRKLLSGMITWALFLTFFVVMVIVNSVPASDLYSIAFFSLLLILGYGTLISLISEYVTKNRWYALGVHVLGGILLPNLIGILAPSGHDGSWSPLNIITDIFTSSMLLFILPALVFGVIDQLVLRKAKQGEKESTI